MISCRVVRCGLAKTSFNTKTLLAGSQVVEQQRFFAAQVAERAEECPAHMEEITFENAKPYEAIPGPSKYDMIRGFLPGGKYYRKSMEHMIQINMEKYGPIYRVPGLFGKKDIITTTNPEDMPIIYRNEGVWPFRRPFEFIVHHRNVLRKDYYSEVPGLIWSNGEQWGKMRSAVNPILMNPNNAKLYFQSVQDISDDFLEKIREVRDRKTNEVPEDFENEIVRLSFETVCSIALNRQLGLLKSKVPDARAEEMMSLVRKFLYDSFDLEIVPSLWKIYETKKFRDVMNILDRLTEICDGYIKEAWAKIEQDKDGHLTTEIGKEKSVLEKLGKIDHKIAVITAIDLLMAGVDTTSSTLTAILLCLSKNPEKQEKLFEELKEVLPSKDAKFTMQRLKHLPYLRACVKESMRLIPITVSTFRQLPTDVVLSGYKIPAGTDVMGGSIAYYNHPDSLPRAKEFIPERWLRSERKKENLLGKLNLPFMYVPFGFGPRMCAGKRLVDLELEIYIGRLIRNFEMSFNYPIENAFQSRLIITPQIPLKFTFRERTE